MLASVVVAYIITPWAANRWLHRHEVKESDAHAEEAKHGRHGRMERLYLRLIRPLQDRPAARLGFAALIVVLMTASVMQGAWQLSAPPGSGARRSALGVNIGFLPRTTRTPSTSSSPCPRPLQSRTPTALYARSEHFSRKITTC